MTSAAPTRSLVALAGSLVLHLLIGSLVVFYGNKVAESAAPPPPVDLWVGTTLEIAGETLAGDSSGKAPAEEDEAGGTTHEATALGRGAAEQEAEPASLAPSPGSDPEPETAPRRAPAPVQDEEYVPDEGMGIDDALAATEPDEPEAPSRSEPEDDLARRVLAYRPKVTSKPVPEGTQGAAPPSGPMGAEGAAAEPRDFGRAFTRAIPAANTADAAWDTLPLGEVGTLRFSVEVDEDGRIGEADLGKDPAPLFERVVGRTLRALRGGRFALQDGTRSGVQRLSMTITVSTHVRDEAPLALGFRSPRQGSPGKAYFELPTGRRVEMIVALLP